MRILFLGTAGGRRVTFKQMRASGGFLVESGRWRVHVDPGPGALVRLVQCGIDPGTIEAILLTHRHLDHSGDVNTLVEARTMGGWTRGGALFAPRDALEGEDPVVFRYHRRNLDRVEVITPGWETSWNGLVFRALWPHVHHGVETYGLMIEAEGVKVGYVADGRLEEGLGDLYRGADLLILNTTFRRPRDMDHLSVEEAIPIISRARPRWAVITHFSMEMVGDVVLEAAAYLQDKTGVDTIPARDFMEILLHRRGREVFMEESMVDLVHPLGLGGGS